MSGGRQWAGGGPPRLVCDHFIDVLSLNHHHHCTEGEQRGDAAILGNRVPKFKEELCHAKATLLKPFKVKNLGVLRPLPC